MAAVTFFHQERVDGGRRSGVTVDGTTVLHGFVPGSEDFDPTLEWFADIALSTAHPPAEATALTWLNSHKAEIDRALTEAANRLKVGIDAHSMPAEFESPGSEGPIRLSISALRRSTGRRIGERLMAFANMDWSELFPVLTPLG